MRALRVLISAVLVAALVMGVYLFVSYLLDRGVAESTRKCISVYDKRFKANDKPDVSWGGSGRSAKYFRTRSYSVSQDFADSRSRKVLLKMLRSRDATERLWAAVIAADCGLLREGVMTLVSLLDEDADYAAGYTYAEAAWEYLLKYLGETRPPGKILTAKERERVRRKVRNELDGKPRPSAPLRTEPRYGR